MTTNDLIKIEKMLTAVLKSAGHIHWIGGYVCGRTSNDDPFIILYPAADYLQEKAVRVYEHDFKKLPAFISTNDVPGDTDNNPSKDKAQRRGIYHECPVFQIVTYDGRETQMGREKRFGDVLYAPNAPQAQERPSTPPQPQQPQTSGNGRLPAKATQKPASRETAVSGDPGDHWLKEAGNCRDQLMFVTAVLKGRPWYIKIAHVESFLEVIFGGFNPDQARAQAAGLFAYADLREAGMSHNDAKFRAIAQYQEVVNESK